MPRRTGALVLLATLAGLACAGPSREGTKEGALVGSVADGFDGAIEGAVEGGALDALEGTPAEQFPTGYPYGGSGREDMVEGTATGVLVGGIAEGFDGAVAGAIATGALGGLD